MANAFSDYAEDQILGLLVGTTVTAPTGYWVGLLTVMPGDTGSAGTPADGTEAAGTGYARVSVGTIGTWMSAISTVNTTQRHRTNANVLTFPQAGGSWGTIIGWGLYDAASAGHLWFYGSITSQAITSGMTPSLAANSIDIAVD